jgi:hypothetical protein
MLDPCDPYAETSQMILDLALLLLLFATVLLIYVFV